MADRALRFDLVGRDKSLGRTLKKGERDTERFRQRISGIGVAAGGAALAGLGILGAGALKLAGDFDDAYDTIRVGTGKTGKSLASLKKDFRAVVRDIPADFGDASTAVAELNRRTGQTGKPLQALAKRTLELTRLTGGDLTQNIASVTRLFGDWGIKTGDQSQTLDKLFRASQATGVGIDDLAQSVVKFGAPLRQLGFSFDDSITMLAKFEKEGVNSGLVMSGMKIALGKLAKAGKDPQKGFLDLAQRIKDAGSSASANKIAIEAFGQRAGPDMAAAIREGRLSIKDLQKQITDGKDTILGAAKDAEDFGEKWKRVTNKIKLLAEPVVTAGLDILSDKTGDLEKFLTKNLIPKLGGLRDKWNENKDAILGLLDPFAQVNDKSKTADQRAQDLADSLTTATEGIGKIARGLKTAGDVLNEFYRRVSTFADNLRTAFTPAAQQVLGFTRFSLGQWRALAGGAATLVEHLPGGKSSGLGKALRSAERQIGDLERGVQREFDDITSLSRGVEANAPGGSKSGFGRSLGKASKQSAAFRKAHNAEMARLAGKVITVTGRAKIDWSAFDESEKRHRAQYKFQSGGLVPGAGTGDKVPAALEPGEVVWPNREPDRKRLLRDPKVRARLGFQRGGVVLGVRGLAATEDKLLGFARQVAPRLGGDVGGSLGGNLRKVLAGYADRFAKAALKKFLAGNAGIKGFIKSTDPLPYRWGAAGPGAYDCSGLVSAVYGKHTGRGGGHGQRYFTTATIGTGVPGLKPGLGGVLQIGVTPARGHMAGRYGGLGFEAESTRTGIKVGAAASSPESFARHFHMARGGVVDAEMLQRFARLTKADIGGDPGKLRIDGQTFDRGGTLAPGLNLLANRTGRPEPLTPAGGTVRLHPDDIRAIARALHDTGIGAVNIDSRRVEQVLAGARLTNARRG